MTLSRPILLSSAVSLAACGGSSSGESGAAVPPDRPILDWYGAAATDANQAALPSGFSGPDEHVCASDTTRAYLGELFVYGTSNPEVLWHWAPVVAGPHAGQPTLDQPDFSLAGTLLDEVDSTDDVLADHPFGLDVTADVTLDSAFQFLSKPDEGPAGSIHTEVENRILPRTAVGWAPAAGDRTIMRGVWVLDCGHPPYGAEMHPPSFLAFARKADDRTTEAAAVFVPYRSSLLFNRDPAPATDFANDARFGLSTTKPFPTALVDDITHAVFYGDDHLVVHNLMVANRFDNLSWVVCAPLPRPAGATLDATWHLTARSGVTLDVTSDDSSGCVTLVAAMTASYSPMPLPAAEAIWSWEELSASASGQVGQPIDVRQAIITSLASRGIDASTVTALQPDHPPHIDAYAALSPRAAADQDAPLGIDAGADDQPFPLYGRIEVAWK